MIARTIILISHRYMDNYDFDCSLINGDRLISIVLADCLPLFPEEKKKYFAKIYTINKSVQNHGPLVKFNYEELKEIVLSELKVTSKENISLVCIDEINLLTIAKLRGEFNLSGLTHSQILKFQDKILMKESLANADILLPQYEKFNTHLADKFPENYYKELQSKLGSPFILKPTQYSGSFGAAVIDTFTDFERFLGMGFHNYHDYEADQFIKGDLYHCDLAIVKGKTVFLECCKYSCPNINFANGEIIASLILQNDNPLKGLLAKNSLKALSKLGLDSGVFHFEFFITPEGLIYFLEVAARPAGGLVALMYEKITNINLFTLDLLITLGRPVPPLKFKKIHCLQALLPINAQTLKSFKNNKFNSSIEINWLIDPDNIPEASSKSVVEVAAKLLLTSGDYNNVAKDFESLKLCSKV